MRWRSLALTGILLILIGIGFALLPKEWIEETFGFEPDGGNGWLEFVIAALPVLVGVVLLTKALVLRREGISPARTPTA